MKKTIFYALIAVISFTFVSCEQSVDEKKLLGKWTLIEVSEAEYLNDRLMWSGTKAIEGDSYFIEFLADGQYMSPLWGMGTYSISEDASRIYLKEEDGYYTYSITELTKSNLEFLYSETEKDSEGTYRWEEVYRFTKK